MAKLGLRFKSPEFESSENLGAFLSPLKELKIERTDTAIKT